MSFAAGGAAGRPARIGSVAAIVAVLALAGQAQSLAPARAATPAGGTLTVPALPGSVSVSWTGTVQPGASSVFGGGLRCDPHLAFATVAGQGVPADSTPGMDDFHLQLAGLTSAFYAANAAELKVEVDWSAPVNSNMNALQLTTWLDDGKGGISAPADGAPGATNDSQVVDIKNPTGATSPAYYDIAVCPAHVVTAQAYSAKATLTLLAPPPPPPPPPPPGPNTVAVNHPVTHSFAPVEGIGVGTGTCLPRSCDSYGLTLQYPGPRVAYLAANVVTLHLHYTWPDKRQDLDVFSNSPSGVQSGPGSPDSTNPDSGYEDLYISNPEDGAWTIDSEAGQATSPTPATLVATLVSTPVVSPTPTLPTGAPTFAQYHAPTTGNFNFASSEPSLGVDGKTGALMYEDELATGRVTFDDTKSPPVATWTDVTNAVNGTVTLDPILYTDRKTGRTIVSQLLVSPDGEGPVGCSLSEYTDDDGATWTPNQGCGLVSGADHQSVGGGPFGPSTVPSPGLYPDAVYYCAQGQVDATCSRSLDGGQTFGPAVPLYNLTACGGLHGHVKVGPDGTAYVPNRNCGGMKAAVTSSDGGQTWTVNPIPGSAGGDTSVGHDPSISVGPDGMVYEGFIDGHGQSDVNPSLATQTPKIAVYNPKTKAWSTPVDVGQAWGIKNADFAEVIAGDPGRAAFAFIGTTTPGLAYDASFEGAWYMFVAFTYDYGKTWTTVNATPGDPVQRGCVWNSGGSNTCRNLLDFNDANVDNKGNVVVAFTDGCTDACVGSPTDFEYGTVAGLVRQTGGNSVFDTCKRFGIGCPTGGRKKHAAKRGADQARAGSGAQPGGSAPLMWLTGAVLPDALLPAVALGAAAALGVAVGVRRRRRLSRRV